MARRLASSIVLACLFAAAAAAPPVPAQEVESAALVDSLYTKHGTRAVQAEIIVLRLDQKFDADEHQKIRNAVVVWNHVLNGHVRFEVDPSDFGDAETKAQAADNKLTDWAIVRTAGQRPKRGATSEELAVTERMPTGGGMMIVNADLLERFSLENVILHELGHVLGLDHNPRSRLMSTDYVLDRQGCVDKVTVGTLATLRRLPVDELNWCVPPRAGSSR